MKKAIEEAIKIMKPYSDLDKFRKELERKLEILTPEDSRMEVIDTFDLKGRIDIKNNLLTVYVNSRELDSRTVYHWLKEKPELKNKTLEWVDYEKLPFSRIKARVRFLIK